MPPLLDRLVGIYCPDVPWVRAGVARILEDAREEGRNEQQKWMILATSCYLVAILTLTALFYWACTT